jgi:hypothetical protein
MHIAAKRRVGDRLGYHLGSRDPAHLRRWLTALMAGRMAAPTCDGITRTGSPCRRQRLHGSRFCSYHAKGAERDRVDQLRLARQHKRALSASASERGRALQQLGDIERRLLYRAWRKDPLIEASTLELSPDDEARVREFLLRRGLDLDAPDRVTGEPLTPRAIDRARWAAQRGISQLADERGVRRRIEDLLRDERRFWVAHKAVSGAQS